jgi:hypothetical protein
MSSITEPQRAVLLDVADVLIPETDAMPSLRAADPDGEWLERACRARADLVDELCQILDEIAGSNMSSLLVSMHRDQRPRFDVLATFAAGAPAPLDLAADELSDEIFEGAMNYSGSYRPVHA